MVFLNRLVKIRKKKFLLTMLGFLFAAMVLLSLLQFFIFYTGFLDRGMDILHTYNLKVFESVSRGIDFVHENYKSLAVNLFLMNDIQAALYGKSLDYLQINQTRNIVETIRAFYPEIHSIYLYNNKIDTFYTFYSGVSQLMQPGKAFPDTEIRATLISEEGPVKKLLPIPRMTFRNLSNADSGKIQVLSYVMYEKPELKHSINGAVVINIEASHIVNLLGSNTLAQDKISGPPGSSFYVVGMEGEVISFSGTELSRENISLIIEQAEKDNLEPVTMRVRGEKLIVSLIKKEQIGWYLLSLVPVKNISSSLKPGKLFFFISSLFLIPLVLLLVLLLARKFYTPIKELVSTVEHETGAKVNEEKPEGELEYLVNSFKSTVKQTKILEQFRNDNLITVRNEYLVGLLEGRVDTGEKAVERFQEYNVPLDPEKPMVLILLMIDHYKKFLDKIGTASHGIFPFSVGNIAQNYLFSLGPCSFAIPTENTITVILNLSEDCSFKKLSSNLLFLLKEIKKELTLTVTAALGEPVQSLDAVSDAYSQAKEIMSYNMKREAGMILTKEDVPEGGEKQYRFPVHQEEAILEGIKQEDLEGIRNHYRAYADCIGNEKAENVVLSMTRLASSVFDTIRLIETNSTLNFQQDFTVFFNRLNECESITEFNDLFDTLFCDVICLMKEKRNSQTAFKVEEAKNIIHNSYKDQCLCTEKIAEQLDISPVYFRHIFKTVTGQSVSEYIDVIRIDAFKGLLAESGRPIKNIYTDIGVTNRKYFAKKFKRYAGVTPRDYRQSRDSAVV